MNPADEEREWLTSMGLRHPSEATHAERQEATAQLHERFARAFAKVGDQRTAKTAQRAARVARSNTLQR